MPTVYALLPEPKRAFLDSNGDPASGYQLFIYTAGSSTKATTYTESDGNTANSNPVVLDSRGEPPSGIYVESGTYKMVLATDTDTDPPSSAIWTRDNVSPINDTSTTVDQFTASGLTPTFVGSTSFTLVGDQRSTFHIGRRIKSSNSGGTGYHTITNSTYSSPNTTVTVANDSTALDSGLSSVSLSILTADSTSSIPGVEVSQDDWTHQGDVTVEGTIIPTQGADVASASALNVAIPGNAFDVTGTATITSIASKGVGTHITLQFDGALTLTHHATDLILPGGANITTAAGDIAQFYEYASGDWRCTSYTKASGEALVLASAIVLGTEQASTSGTAINFTSIPSGTQKITVMLEGVSTSSTDEWILQIGDSGGLETSGYSGVSAEHTASANAFHANSSFSGFTLLGNNPNAAQTYDVVATLTLKDAANNTWAISGTGARNDAGSTHSFAGHKSLSAELDRLTITTQDGTDTFDAGSINIAYE